MRLAVAFATEGGVRALHSMLAAGGFEDASKRWLIGLDTGLTQPEALRHLLSLPNSEVRAPQAREVLDSSSLRGPTFFHPKLYALDREGSKELGLVSSSANLTEGGLLNNIEQYLVWSGDRTDPTGSAFESWWSRAWKRATPMDEALIAEYDAKRPVMQPGPPRRPTLPGPVYEEEPAPSDLRAAQWMWTEAAKALSGGSQNQLELIKTAYHFFYEEDDPPRDDTKKLEFIDEAGNVFIGRGRAIGFWGPPRITTRNPNFMWRVGLPTRAEGMSGYQDGGVLIKFSRTDTPDRYR